MNTATTSEPVAPARDSAGRLVALGSAITVAFCALFALGLWESRSRDRDQARLAAQNVVASMSSEIERNLELYGISLEAVVDGLKMHGIDALDPELRQRVLFDRSASAKDMGSIVVLDRNGTLTHDSRIWVPMPEDHSERDYFLALKRNPRAGFYVSQPWRAIDGDYIAISRTLTDDKGRFTGVVAGSMRLSYFASMFSQINLGPRDTVTLIRDSGELIMRAPFLPELIGRSFAGTPAYERISAASSGWFEKVGGLDGVERMFVFRRIADYPLILSYNLATDDIYAPWRRKAWLLGALAVSLCAINLMLLGFLVRALRKHGEAEARMAAMATTDSLTGIANRRALDAAFAREWNRAMRSRTPVSLLMLDADHFKAYNDAFGHQAGDAALAAIADCIRLNIRRASEMCARYGGEEFAVLLPGLAPAEAAVRAEAIRSSLTALRKAQHERPDSVPTVSIGVACMIPRQGLEPRDLVKLADSALYEAKTGGRDRVEIAGRFAAAQRDAA